MRRRISILIAALVAVLLVGAAIPAASAQESRDNPNPIDWTVQIPFTGALGDDIPLLVGQSDFRAVGLTLNGFGARHIVDAHGVLPPRQA